MDQSFALVAAADQAIVRGDRLKAAELLERAAQSSRDNATLIRLATVRRSLGDLQGALAAATAAAKNAPNDGITLMLLGSLRDAVGAPSGGGRAYRAAVRNLPSEYGMPDRMREQVQFARRRAAAEDEWHMHIQAWHPDPSLSEEEASRMEGLRLNLLSESRSGPLAAIKFMIPEIPAAGFYDPSQFAGVAELEKATDVIRDEFLHLAETKARALSSSLRGLGAAHGESSGKWSMIPLIRNGAVVEEFASLCPQTMRLGGLIDPPKLGLISPSLYFSVLEPGSRIAPHTGITNARLIVHWPLIVPDNCRFRVGGETRQWEPGEALIFDDMTEHEAWNDSDRIRVVLISDLWRPELSQGERAAVERLMERKTLA